MFLVSSIFESHGVELIYDAYGIGSQDCNDGVQMCSWNRDGACPAHFTDVCILVETVAGRAKLRSAHHGELIVPPTRTKTCGSRSFRSAAPTVWNSLPHHIRQSDISRGQFASRLKTWLLSCAYA